MTALTVTKRGTITLPISLRKKWGRGKAARIRLQMQEQAGGVLLRPVSATGKAAAESKVAWMADYLDQSPAAKARRRIFIKQLNAEYTPEVCAETLRINEEYPVHDDLP